MLDRFAAEADEVAIALQVLTEPAAERVGPGLALEEAPGLVLGVVAFVEVGQQVLDGLGVAQLGVARVEHGRGAVGLLLDQVDDGVGELGDAARITLPGPGLGADGELSVAARNTSLGPGLGASGELSVAARNTLPRIDLGAAGKLVVAARNTLPGPGLGADGELGGAARTTLPRVDLGAAGKLVVAARNTLPRIDLGAAGELGDAARITLPGPRSPCCTTAKAWR